MKTEELLEIGLTEEQANKVLVINGKDIERYKKAAETAKTDLTAAQEQLAQRDKDMEELKKSAGDVDSVKQQLADLQAKYTTETERYQKQIADRDYSDAVSRAIAEKGVKFSSKAAEKAFIADLTANRLSVKDGALDGFEHYLKAQQESDPTAFQSDKPTPTFVKPVGPGGPPSNESKGAMYAKQFNQMYTPTNTNKE
jgi:hypothetical protein|nr:MAG TPA: minor structural protein [Bacteriophage sp.]